MPSEITRRQRAALVLTATLSLLAKLVLAIETYGTNDVYTYHRFAVWSRYFGADLYNIAPDLNHPPSMLYVLRFLLWCSEHTPLPFQFWIRFPGILADAGTLWLICRILGPRLAEKRVFIATLLIAIGPIHILVSGFHGNTDPIMIFFVMAAVWLAGSRDKLTSAGVAFGMAFCIKIAPVILVPAFFLWLREAKRRLSFFLGAAAVVLLSWTPYVLQQPAGIYRQVFGYKSSYGLWGISYLMRQIANVWPRAQWFNFAFSKAGTPIVLIAIAAVSFAMNRMKRPPSLYMQIGMVFFVFFAATSGFAVQYLVWMTPWIAELGVLAPVLYVSTGSVFLLVVYNYWTLGTPWYMAIAYPWGTHQYFQVLCWLSVLFLCGVASKQIRRDADFPARQYGPVWIAVAAAAFVGLLAWPAVVHMRRDKLAVTPAYAQDAVLYTRADEFNNLATELARHGRRAEAEAVVGEARRLAAQADKAYYALVAAQPIRNTLRVPEDYVEYSLNDYNSGDWAQCVYDATEALRLRPGMPAAWNNITLCKAEMGDWDGAIEAAKENVRLEPELPGWRENLRWALENKQRTNASAGALRQ